MQTHARRAIAAPLAFATLMLMTMNVSELPAQSAVPTSSGVSGMTTTDDLSALSTRFETPASLAGWREHTVPGFPTKWAAPVVKNGLLELRPHSSGWFEDMQAGHLYRAVTGNFIVTARLRVAGTSATLPQTLFSLAGLFVRAERPGLTADNWTAGQENWLFFSLGSASPAGTPQFETKTTWNSLSTLKIADASIAWRNGTAQWVDLRIARQGELFSLLYRVEGEETFTLLDQIIRPDLPATLNVGMTAYSDWGAVASIYPDMSRINRTSPATTADLVAYVERVDFRRPTVARFAVATLDPAVSFDPAVSQARLQDLTRDRP